MNMENKIEELVINIENLTEKSDDQSEKIQGLTTNLETLNQMVKNNIAGTSSVFVEKITICKFRPK